MSVSSAKIRRPLQHLVILRYKNCSEQKILIDPVDEAKVAEHGWPELCITSPRAS